MRRSPMSGFQVAVELFAVEVVSTLVPLKENAAGEVPSTRTDLAAYVLRCLTLR